MSEEQISINVWSPCVCCRWRRIPEWNVFECTWIWEEYITKCEVKFQYQLLCNAHKISLSLLMFFKIFTANEISPYRSSKYSPNSPLYLILPPVVYHRVTHHKRRNSFPHALPVPLSCAEYYNNQISRSPSKEDCVWREGPNQAT